MDAEGLGRTETKSNKMLTLQALSSSLNSSTAKAEERPLGDLRQSVPPKQPRPFTHYRHKLLRVSLKAPALTGYIGDAKPKNSVDIQHLTYSSSPTGPCKTSTFIAATIGSAFFSAPHNRGGRAELAPEGPFLAQFAPFELSPRLLSPRLDFPEF